VNSIEQLRRHLDESVAGVSTKLRRPRDPEGTWWLDASLRGHDVTIEWSPRRGFGISASFLGDGYGEGPEETFKNLSDAVERTVHLLRSGENTSPPREVVLHELRALVGVTQETLAERLGVQQAAVSRLERREEISLSSLRRYVHALGAQLEINIRVADGDVVRLSPPIQKRAAR